MRYQPRSFSLAFRQGMAIITGNKSPPPGLDPQVSDSFGRRSHFMVTGQAEAKILQSGQLRPWAQRASGIPETEALHIREHLSRGSKPVIFHACTRQRNGHNGIKTAQVGEEKPNRGILGWRHGLTESHPIGVHLSCTPIIPSSGRDKQVSI